MKPTNERIIVRVDMEQKHSVLIEGVPILLMQQYETNYREKSPIIAQVVEGNEVLAPATFILCHHNHFYTPSPYHLQDDLYSIPANHTIFATISSSGELSPVYGNVLASKVEITGPLPVPAEFREFYKDRGVIMEGGDTEFEPGDLVFTRPSAIYEIVYMWGGEQRRICKINSEMIGVVVRSASGGGCSAKIFPNPE